MLRYLLALITILFFTGCGAEYQQRNDVQTFIQQMSAQHNFNQQQLTALFSQVKFNPRIITTMTAPHENLPWYRYQALFVTPERAKAGADYWRQHVRTLAAAEKKYGVPAQIIIAILGVETNYGRFQGTYRVLDSLATLAFDYPARAPFFRGELEQYLLLTREIPIDPLEIRGSYAGAIGQPQFMPSSYRRYGVDSTGKGYSDLIHNSKDVIFSVANYFKGYGWQSGQPVAARAQVTGQKVASLMSAKSKKTLVELKQYGVSSKLPSNTAGQAAILSLEGASGPEYWLAFQNFDVIMRYNTSSRYAMAVYQLGEAIKAKYLSQVASQNPHNSRHAAG